MMLHHAIEGEGPTVMRVAAQQIVGTDIRPGDSRLGTSSSLEREEQCLLLRSGGALLCRRVRFGVCPQKGQSTLGHLRPCNSGGQLCWSPEAANRLVRPGALAHKTFIAPELVARAGPLAVARLGLPSVLTPCASIPLRAEVPSGK